MTRIGLMALVGCLTMSGQAAAETWGDAGAWTISYDGSGASLGCAASISYHDGTILVLTVNAFARTFGIVLVQARWAGVEDGKSYPVQIFNDKYRTRRDMKGARFGGHGALSTEIDTNDIANLMAAKGMQFRYEGQVIADLSLRGSDRAIGEMWKCQQTKNPAGSPLNNPPAG